MNPVRKIFSNRVKLLKMLAILSLLIAIIYPKVGVEKKKIDVPDILAGFLPEGSLVTKMVKEDFIYYEVYNRTEDLAGFVFLAEGEGYGGPIKFFIFCDTDGKIQKVHVFEHRESPEYVTSEKLNDFLARFEGKRISQGLWLHEDIDAITQATITSFVILEGMNEAGKRALQIGVLDKEKARYRDRLKIKPEVWGLLFLFSFSMLAYLTRRKALRWAVLLFALVFLGFIQSYILSLPVLVNILSLRLPFFPEALFWFLIYGFAIFSVIWAGRFYCGWLCPFGAALDLLGKINPLRSKASNGVKGNLKIPPSFDKYLRCIKYLLLWGLLFFALIRRNPQLADYEPFATLFTLKGSVISWGYLLLFLVLGIFFSRVFCRYFCAAGAALAFLSPICRRKLEIGEKCNKCNSCAHCINICPMGAIRKMSSGGININYSECIECNLCLRICPEKAIRRR